MSRSLTILRKVFSVLVLVLAAAPASAQYIYGVSALQLDSGIAYGFSATDLDYYACYYYDAVVAGALYEDGALISSDSYHGVCSASAYTAGLTHDDRYYTQHSDHYVIAYYYDYYYGYYDPYGYGYFGPGDHGGGFNYYGYYGPYYFPQQSYYLGWTQVTLFNPGPCSKAPSWTAPNMATRGGKAITFTLKDVCSTATINWSFSDGVNPPVTQSGGITWSGPMVTSGVVKARVVQGGKTYDFSTPVAVFGRSNFAFAAVPATKQANGAFRCVNDKVEILQVPDPPTAQDRQLGEFLLCLRYTYGYDTVPSGPNKGYRYVTTVSDSISGAIPPQSTFAWTITPQLDDPTSDFYRAQCGRDGYISGAKLRENAIAHESGTKNSHYSRYVAAQSANNIKAGLEPIIGPPGESESTFKNRVETEGNSRLKTITDAAEVEPCGGDASLDEDCKSQGIINFAPYRPCSPVGLGGQVGSPSRIDLSWTDGSFNETGFRVERRDDPGSVFTVVGTTPAGVTSFSDTSVVRSRAYVYRVVALSAASDSPASNEVRVAIPTAPPNPPSNFSGGAVSATQIDLSWNRGGGEEEAFRIERSDAGSAFVEIAVVGAEVTWFSDASVIPNTTYTYRVIAVNSLGSSAPSAETTVSTFVAAPPAAPCCLFAENLYGGGSVTFTWADLSDNEDGFTLERSDTWEGEFHPVAWTLANQTSATEYGLKSGLYRYRVVAENAYGRSYSEEVYYNAP